MANYRDETHIKPNEFNIDQEKISPEVKKLATFIREKMYGVDVREAIALAVELISTSDLNSNFDNELQGLRNIAYTISAGSDKGESNVEVQTARTNINGHEYVSVGARLDAIEREIKRLGGTIDV
ncbi:hypothetical protein [Weissella paramesenteroides]|uniref:hypothetical protein n=1 Tax=Weissella paramesenteroides TaxID=1249 RepID=UPI00398294C8